MNAPAPTPSISPANARAAEARAVSPVPTGVEAVLIVLALGVILGLVLTAPVSPAATKDRGAASSTTVARAGEQAPVSMLPALGAHDLRTLVWTRGINVDLRTRALAELEARLGTRAAVVEALRVIRQEKSPSAGFVAFIAARPTPAAAPLLVDAMASERIAQRIWERDIAPAWASTLKLWAHQRITRAPARVREHSASILRDASLAAFVLATVDPASLVERAAIFVGASDNGWSLARATAQERAHAAALCRALGVITAEPFATSAWALLSDVVLPAVATAVDEGAGASVVAAVRLIATVSLSAMDRLLTGPLAELPTMVRARLINAAIATLNRLQAATADSDVAAALEAQAAALAQR